MTARDFGLLALRVVRVYTEFATLDAVSNGRAQLIVGRGSLTESFPLFAFDLAGRTTQVVQIIKPLR